MRILRGWAFAPLALILALPGCSGDQGANSSNANGVNAGDMSGGTSAADMNSGMAAGSAADMNAGTDMNAGVDANAAANSSVMSNGTASGGTGRGPSMR